MSETELHEGLTAHLASCDHDALYTCERVLKETEWERTEVVKAPDGTQRIRKYLRHEGGFGSQYRSVASIGNPALPRICEVYELSDRTVVIMEYLQGPTLRELVEVQGPLSLAQAAAILKETCAGVAALHHVNPPVIHRDLNPSNIICSPEGAKPIDFGIARQWKAEASRDTRTWGTAGYAAPEQLGFGQSDVRTDIYALGMILYFLLAGCDPAPDIRDTLSGDHRIPPSARKTIARCISMEPANRYRSTHELVTALDQLIASTPAAAAKMRAKTPQKQASRKEPWGQRCHVFYQSHRAARILWHYWQANVAVIFILLLVAAFQMTTKPWMNAYPFDHTLEIVIDFSIAVLIFLPLWLVTLNPKGMFTTSKRFTSHPIRCTIIFLIAWLTSIYLLIGIPASLQSDDFKEIKLEQQQNR